MLEFMGLQETACHDRAPELSRTEGCKGRVSLESELSATPALPFHVPTTISIIRQVEDSCCTSATCKMLFGHETKGSDKEGRTLRSPLES